MQHKKILYMTVLALTLCLLFQVTAFAASGDVAGAVQNTWTTASGQIKTVVNNVVFPAIDIPNSLPGYSQESGGAG